VVAQQQIHRGGLAAAAGALQQIPPALLDGQREPAQDLTPSVVAEIHVPEADPGPESRGQGTGSGVGEAEKGLHLSTDRPDGEPLPQEGGQGDQGPGKLVDHADGHEKVPRGEVPQDHQPRGAGQDDEIRQVRDQRGDQLGDGAQAGVGHELVHGVVVDRPEPAAEAVLRGKILDDLKARQPVRDPRQHVLHGLQVRALGPLEPLFHQLGHIQRRGQQRDGQHRHSKVQPEQGGGDEADLQQDLPQLGPQAESLVPDGLGLGHEFGDVFALGVLPEADEVPAEDAIEKISAEIPDAADGVFRAEPVEQIVKQALAQDQHQQNRAGAQCVGPAARGGEVQDVALEKLQHHGAEGAEEGADKCRGKLVAVVVFVGFHVLPPVVRTRQKDSVSKFPSAGQKDMRNLTMVFTPFP